jgi:hypothetical protein
MDKCPHIITRQADDESFDFCELVDKPCLLISGDACDIWNEIQKEWETEEQPE